MYFDIIYASVTVLAYFRLNLTIIWIIISTGTTRDMAVIMKFGSEMKH